MKKQKFTNSNFNSSWKSYLVIIFLSFLLTGCVSLLTKSQITEIKKFSAASSSYSEYPGIVIKGHADLSFYNQLTNASAAADGETAFKSIEKGFKKRARYIKLGQRADKACSILRSYSSILNKLSSDQYSNDTQASLEKLGKSMDNSIKDYNKITNSSLSTFGGLIAASLRGVGSMYIKSRQHKAIKTAIKEADPLIEKITKSITELLNTYSGPDSLEIIKAERDDLKNWYVSSGYRQPISTAQWIAKELESTDNLLLLIEKSKKAASTLREAHRALLTKIDKKIDLKDSIEIIETLIDEVKAAKDLKDKIEG